MPKDDVAPTPAPVDVSPPVSTPAPVDSPAPTPVAKPAARPYGQRVNKDKSSTAFDEAVAATKAEEAAAEEAAKPKIEPKAEEPDEDDKSVEEPKADEPDDDEDDEDDKSKAPPKEEPKAEDEPKDDEPEDSKSQVTDFLKMLKDPDLLEAALKQADVGTVTQLPYFKDLMGRVEQSTRDRIMAEVQKNEYEKRNVQDILVRGQAAADEVASAIEQLAKDIDEGNTEFKLPEKQYILDKFNEFAEAARHAYHNEHFGDIAQRIYTYPELLGLNDEQKAELQSVNGEKPGDWFEKTYEVARGNLWRMAQQQVAQKASEAVEERTKLLVAAHEEEVTKLKEKHERVLTKAVEKAKEEARAAAFVDIAKNGPPRETPKDSSASVVSDEADDIAPGSSIDQIWAKVKSRQESTGV
jgi:hypothetical protein